MQLQHLDHTRMANDHLVALLKAIPDLLFERTAMAAIWISRAMNDELFVALTHICWAGPCMMSRPEAATEADGVHSDEPLATACRMAGNCIRRCRRASAGLSYRARKDELHQGRLCFTLSRHATSSEAGGRNSRSSNWRFPIR